MSTKHMSTFIRDTKRITPMQSTNWGMQNVATVQTYYNSGFFAEKDRNLSTHLLTCRHVLKFENSTSANGLVVKSNVAIVGPPVRFRVCAFFLHILVLQLLNNAVITLYWLFSRKMYRDCHLPQATDCVRKFPRLDGELTRVYRKPVDRYETLF